MKRVPNAWSLLVPLVFLGSAPAWGQEPERVEGGGGVGLAVYEAGNPAGPPIVFLHGFLGSHLNWASQFSGTLAQTYRLIAIDLRGHGASEKPLVPQAYTSPTVWADDIAAVIRAKDLHRPVLVGWSSGGFMISDYIRVHGDAELGGVVLVASTSTFGTDRAMELVGEDVLAAVGAVLALDVATSIEGTRAFLPLLTERPMDRDGFEAALAAAMMVPPQVRGAMFGRSFDNEEVLRAVSVPALVIQGNADRIVLPLAAEVLADLIPGARLVSFDGVGHAPFLEDPTRFDRELDRFVRAIHP
jgi:non-heme chloroperoxidase